MPRAPGFRHGSEFVTSNSYRLFEYFASRFGATDFDTQLKVDRPWTIRTLACGPLTLGYSANQSPFHIRAAQLPSLVFTFNAAGNTNFSADRQSFSPPAGVGMLLSNPGERISYLRTPGEGNFIAVETAQLEAVAKAINGPLAARLLRERLRQPLCFTAFAGADGGAYARSVIHSLQLVDSVLLPGQPLPAALCLDDLIQRQLVLMLCPELAQGELPGHGPNPDQHFEQLLEWLRAHRHEAISLSAMEQRSGYSRRSLQKQFQKRFGCGPMQWLRRCRLELALEQLQAPQPGDSVTSIARRCGYLNLASFSRDFGARYGKRPSEILRTWQERP